MKLFHVFWLKKLALPIVNLVTKFHEPVIDRYVVYAIGLQYVVLSDNVRMNVDYADMIISVACRASLGWRAACGNTK